MPGRTPPTRELKFTGLSDFRPGITTYAGYASGAQAGGGVPLPEKQPGHAQEVNTYRCFALPSGALSPLPSFQAAASNPGVDTGANVLTPYYIVGLKAFGPISPGAGAPTAIDELHVAVEYTYNNAGVNQKRFRWFRFQYYQSGSNTWDQVKAINSAATGIPLPFSGYGVSFDTSRMATASPYTAIGVPVVGSSWTETQGAGGESFVSAFPDPSSPAALGVLDLSTTEYGLLVAHEGRLVVAKQVSQPHGPNANVSFNEAIDYTDPSNSNVWTTPGSVYAPESPAGYGVIKSVNTGELLLIKRVGGGVILSGDMDAINVTRLPFVQPTGNLISLAASTPSGLYYLCDHNGLWQWSGGNGSNKVSGALNDDFFHMDPPWSGVEACVEPWGDWLVISNSWLLDTTNGGFWRVEDPAVQKFMWFSRDTTGGAMFAAPVSQSTPTSPFVYQASKFQPATNFSWQSHPLSFSVNRLVEVREVVVRAEALNGGTVTVTISGNTTDSTNAAQPASFTIPAGTTAPTKIRHACRFKGEDITVRIQSDGGSNAAPTVFEVQVGYAEAQEVNAA